MEVKGNVKLIGEIKVPGDKSISHRSIMLGSISQGNIKIKNILFSQDTLRTIDCFRAMGVSIEADEQNNRATVHGLGLHGLKDPNKPLDCGNSGTTMRLMSGILLGQNFSSTIYGDESLNSRPMSRIINPLKSMGGNISGREERLPPLIIEPSSQLHGINYRLPVASAQVKSAILLASLYSKGITNIKEDKITRDHTERMLQYFNGNIEYSTTQVSLKETDDLIGRDIFVPGDISSAAFFIVGASILKGSSILLKDVGLNPSRTGIIKVLKSMGASIEIQNRKTLNNEEFGDIKVNYSDLKAITLEGNIIGTLIDEIPIIAVAACFAKGKTIIRNAEELKYKETNRIKAISVELRKMGCNIEELEDGLVIHGQQKLNGARLNSYNDHRIAMALTIAALNSSGYSYIENWDCVKISYPNFYNDLKNITYNI